MGFQHAVNNVVGWLRAGYPQGVPPADYVALLGILRRRLTDAEVEYVAMDMIKSSPEPISPDQIGEALRTMTLQTATPEDIARVSAVLAGAGWPLADVEDSEDEPEDEPTADGNGKGNPVRRFVDWIRLGYPAGVPPQDYPPLLAVLHRRLPDAQVDEVCNALLMAGIMPADRVDVGVAISKSLNELPTKDEIDRVLARLAAVGWPVSDPSPGA